MTRRIIPAALALMLVSVSCTPDPRAPSPTDVPVVNTTLVSTTTTTTIPIAQATAAFQACLSENGVEIEEIPLDSQGRPRLELVLTDIDFSSVSAVDALTRCSDSMVAGSLALDTWPDLEDRVQALLAGFSECVRAHGVIEFPDPVRAFTGVGGPYPLEEIPFDDPDLGAAVDICEERLTQLD